MAAGRWGGQGARRSASSACGGRAARLGSARLGVPGLGVRLSSSAAMAETGDKPYRAEYAKSGRASCKKCGESIAKDSLRLALMVQVRRGPALGCAAGGPAVVVPRAESGGPGARPHSAEGRPHPARGAAGSAASTPRGASDGGEESGAERRHTWPRFLRLLSAGCGAALPRRAAGLGSVVLGTHRTLWVGRDANRPWAGPPPASSGCPGPHPTRP